MQDTLGITAVPLGSVACDQVAPPSDVATTVPEFPVIPPTAVHAEVDAHDTP
jgi:hypothetical protein